MNATGDCDDGMNAGGAVATTSRRGGDDGAVREESEQEYLFELAPLGPRDLLARCNEGPGNWWGEVDEDCLRVDESGRVVLVDPDLYYEVCNDNSWMAKRLLRCDLPKERLLLFRRSFQLLLYHTDSSLRAQQQGSLALTLSCRTINRYRMLSCHSNNAVLLYAIGTAAWVEVYLALGGLFGLMHTPNESCLIS